ncbi:hypothetical protein FB567DRAFT_510416 [Paraphoma chrysanthemicola]|uniref:DUF4419 domain-containing protein n=1 Tax=Paraphoma chrysanthemicola TaxID=798071 RepID=A0A8K0RGI0_9PLEO|nr:hypothetical protein FB567DRAFT_510416 [Paraphoma chrysanthemicola]
MPMTFKVADHPSNTFKRPYVTSTQALFSQTCSKEFYESKRIIQSSFPSSTFTDTHITANNNGFVNACWYAYSGHHHLTIRPDDIWFAILSQLNFYINANAESLRSHFVDHEGQKELVIKDVGSIDTFDFGVFARRMTGLIQENVKDPNLRDWIMPTFSTTTVDDRTTAAVLMMGSLQAYFSYTCMLMCGIPSVTLLGERADYEDILHRLDKLEELGSEPTDWAALLRPVLRRFIQSFDINATAEVEQDVKDFWSRIAHVSGGSGPSYISGWLTAFCFWRNDGKCMYKKREPVSQQPQPETGSSRSSRPARIKRSSSYFELDDVVFHVVDTSDIPAGFASVPVKVDDNGTVHNTKMVAGSLGIAASESGEKGETGEGKLDSVRSLSGWLMYEIKEGEAAKEDESDGEEMCYRPIESDEEP